eukprot:gene2413-2877_t
MKETTAKKFWLIVASKDHVKVGTEKGFAQACHGKKTWISKPKKGDKVVFYSSKNQFENTSKENKLMSFTALGTFNSDELTTSKISERTFFRRTVDFEKSTKDVSIKSILDQLEFIKNKDKWGIEVRNGMRQIPKNDYSLIESLMLSTKE